MGTTKSKNTFTVQALKPKFIYHGEWSQGGTHQSLPYGSIVLGPLLNFFNSMAEIKNI